MPLARGMIVGYDVEMMTLRFTMVDASARIIDCAISGSAGINCLARDDQQARLIDKFNF